MINKVTIEKLEEHLEFFNKMYDLVRLVDPIRKETLGYRGDRFKVEGGKCYAYWKKGEICDNCISIRSHHEDRSFMKMEHSKNNIMMVIAIPLEDTERPIVLELMKDATDNMLIGTGNYSEGEMMIDVISSLNDMVVKDSLTSVYNRRFIDERLSVDIIRSIIAEVPLSVIFIDVDNLKVMNDTYGHTVGDFILKEVSKTIDECIRSHDDWVARYGGDEFLVCLNGTDEMTAYKISERIKENVKKIKIPELNEDIEITLSIGIHTMEDEKLTAEEIIRYADDKMYESKKYRKKHNLH